MKILKTAFFPSDSCRTGDEQLSDSGRTAVHRVVGQLSADGQTAVCLRTEGGLVLFCCRFTLLEGAISAKMKGWKKDKMQLFPYIYAEKDLVAVCLYKNRALSVVLRNDKM